MDLFGVLSLIGGLALFLFGMNVLGQGLEKTSGGKLESVLEKLTDNTFKAVLLGAGVTAVIQSSSATTVMVVGFVNSGIMKLSQAVGVIMGANIGTTVTSWILSLSGIDSSNFFIKLLKPESFSPVLAIIGIGMIMLSKESRKKDIGTIFLGFTVLMNGMSIMSSAVEPLADVPEFTNLLLLFSNPILGVLAGTILTAVIQSSSASVGILQALTVTGGITFSTAIPIIMGQNIGTCVTALISCIGANKNAKRAAMVHLYFNLIGTVLFLTAYYGANAVFEFTFVNNAITAFDIAIIHTTFNVLTTAVMLPLNKVLEKLACITIKEKKEFSDEHFLDERFLTSPSFAVEQCRKATYAMAELTKDTIKLSVDNIDNYSDSLFEKVGGQEDRCDKYEDEIGTYLLKLSGKNLSDTDSNEVSMLLHSIGDLERISDHAVNIMEAAKEMKDKGILFSEPAKAELDVMTSAIDEILDMTVNSFVNEDTELASKVEPLEQVIDKLKSEMRSRHIERMRRNECTMETGFIFSDILTSFERVSDHCSNIAVALIEIRKCDSFDTHRYLNDVKYSGQTDYTNDFSSFDKKYELPKY